MNWISVKDRLPAMPNGLYSEDVLVIDKDGCASVTTYFGKPEGWEDDHGNVTYPTHWMYLPEFPK